MSLNCFQFKINQNLTPIDESLNKCQLRIAIFPGGIKQISTEISEYCGAETSILESLAHKLKCRMSFELVSQGIGGGMTSNGTFNGAMGLIQNNKVDVILGQMIYTNDRLKIVEPTCPMFAGSNLAIVSKISLKPDSFSIFESFTYDAWITVFALLIVSVIVNSYRLPNCLTKITDVFLDHFSILIGKVPITSYLNKGIYNRFITAILWANSAFWICLFSNVLLSNMTSNPKLRIYNLEQIIKDDQVKILISFGSYFYNHKLKNYGIEYRCENLSKSHHLSRESLEKLLSGKYVLITKMKIIDNLLNMNPMIPLRESSYQFNLHISGIFMRKTMNSQLKSLLRRRIRLLLESGIYLFKSSLYKYISKLSENIKISRVYHNDFNGDYLPISTSQIKAAFYINIFGCILAFIFFLFENLARFRGAIHKMN